MELGEQEQARQGLVNDSNEPRFPRSLFSQTEEPVAETRRRGCCCFTRFYVFDLFHLYDNSFLLALGL